MGIAEPQEAKRDLSHLISENAPRTAIGVQIGQQRKPRPMMHRFKQLLRRAHLYLGLLLLPWALLYGVTGFLFNHPEVLSDSPVVHFDSQDLNGTELENLIPISATTDSLLELLNSQNESGYSWILGKDAPRYSGRETFVASVKAEGQTYSFVFDPVSKSGFIRESRPNRPAAEAAPFSTAALTKKPDKPDKPEKPAESKSAPSEGSNPINSLETIAEQINRAAPKICERKGIIGGVAICTSGPDIKFPILVDEQEWTATFNPITKQVTGDRGDPAPDLSWRSFLLRMHLSHRYPGAVTTRWLWALGVDAIALTLCFWGLSGLVMWWQIKSTRRAGAIVLIVSLLAAVSLGMSMHDVLTM